jgi:hypothetical protein
LTVPGDGAPSPARPGWIPLLSLLAGSGLVATGAALVVAYIRATLADLSMLFWGLVLPGIGVPLLALGIGMLLLARQARRSPPALRIAKHVLWGLAIVACQQAQALPGLDGDYRWTLQVADGGTILFQVSRTLSLRGASAVIDERIAFAELFRGCFAPAPLPSYACVAHAGSDNLLDVRGQLQWLTDRSGVVAASRARTPPPAAIASRRLRIETFNTGNSIQVRQVAAEPR